MTSAGGERTDARASADALLAAGIVIDATDRPSREAVGLAQGERTAILQRTGEAAFDATLRFEGGVDVVRTGQALLVAADGAAGPVVSVIVRRSGLGLADLDGLLAEAVDVLGVEPGQASAVLAEAHSHDGTGGRLIRTVPTSVRPDGSLVITLNLGGPDNLTVTYEVSYPPGT